MNEFVGISKEYVRISNKLYNEFEKVARRDQECEVVYLQDGDEINIRTKILEFKNIDGTEFMNIKGGITIRLDKIISFNGESTKLLNHY